ncbi:MAG TPA: PAS domain S-box protein [Cytophagaceae bacterium]
MLSSRAGRQQVEPINLYRLILFLCSTFTLFLRYLYVQETPDVFDPLTVRLTFSCLFLIIFTLSFFKQYADKILYLSYMIFCLYTFHSIVLIYKNHFAVGYILEFIILISLVCLGFKDKKHINIYLLVIFAGFALISLIYEGSLLQVMTQMGLVAAFCFALFAFFDLKFKTEQQINIRQNLLDTIFNESPDAMFLIDPSGGEIINCNNRSLCIFNYADKSLINGNNLNLILKNPDLASLLPELKKKMEENKSAMRELEFKTSDGKVFRGGMAVNEIKVKDDSYWLIRIADITEKVHDKKIIEENRKILNQVIDLVPHMIFLKDHEGRYVVVNKAVADNSNTGINNMIGRTDYDFWPKEQADKFTKDDDDVRDTGKEKFIPEEHLTDSKGNLHILQTTKIPFYFEGSDKPGLLGVAIDITERVRDKSIIEENRKMLLEIINLLPHQIYLKDKDHKFLLINKAVAEFFQLPEEEIIGRSDADFFPPEEAVSLKKIEEEVIRSGSPKTIPARSIIDKSGKIRIFDSIKLPFYLEAKKETGILGINLDITEAKLSEKALKGSELKYKMLMEQASDGIYLSDENGNIIDANPKACEMFGYSRSELLQLNVKDLVYSDHSKETPVTIPDLKDRKSIILERIFKKKDSTAIAVEVSAKLLEDGRHQAIVRDITERKRLENIFKDNEKKFRALIENSSDLILILSEDLKVKFVSPSVHRILGYEVSDVLDKRAFEFIPLDTFETVKEFFLRTLSKPGQNHVASEIKIKCKNGGFIYAEAVAVNLLNDRVINGIIINCHDITKRKQTEQELLNTNFELDSFVYKASHDLKAPLRSVMGLIKLAKVESKDPTQHMYLDMMNKSVISLDSFIKDLTQFSRNSRLEIEPKVINFDEIIQESLNNLKFMENADRISVKKTLNIKATFYSDLTRISTIVNNLISNAFKYHRFENNNSYINIVINTDFEKAVLIVEDNGMGIEPIHISRIFDMFYRASENSYGSGLGLYIVKSAIAKLNGDIRVESVVNEGTKFTIEIPNLINDIEEK